MSETQSSPEPPSRATQTPRCPRCQARMAVQHIVTARSGFEHWTMRCTRCGNIHEAQVHTGPMKSDAQGWLDKGGPTPPK